MGRNDAARATSRAPRSGRSRVGCRFQTISRARDEDEVRDAHTYPLGGRLTDAFRLLDACENKRTRGLVSARSQALGHLLEVHHAFIVCRRVREDSITDLASHSRAVVCTRSIVRVREAIVEVWSSHVAITRAIATRVRRTLNRASRRVVAIVRRTVTVVLVRLVVRGVVRRLRHCFRRSRLRLRARKGVSRRRRARSRPVPSRLGREAIVRLGVLGAPWVLLNPPIMTQHMVTHKALESHTKPHTRDYNNTVYSTTLYSYSVDRQKKEPNTRPNRTHDDDRRARGAIRLSVTPEE